MQAMGLQRHVLRRLANAGALKLPHSQRPGRWLVASQDIPLAFSTSAAHSDETKHAKKHHGHNHHDDKSMMDKVKDTVHAGVDKLKSGLEAIDEKVLGDDGLVDKAKEKLHVGMDKTHEQYEKLKHGLEKQDEKVREVASKYFDSVKTDATKVEDMLKDYGENTKEMGADYYERIRDSLDKWNESLMDLETKVSGYSESFGKDVSDYVKQQRRRHAELTRKAKERKRK